MLDATEITGKDQNYILSELYIYFNSLKKATLFLSIQCCSDQE